MRRVLLDTNTLLLFIVGNVEPSRLGGKRLERFDVDDLERLNGFLAEPVIHVSLPNILTEVSNFVGSGNQHWGDEILNAFAAFCHSVDEKYEPSAEVSAEPLFASLGLTDTAILRIARDRIKVFTVDHNLANRLSQLGIEVVNLMHFKTPK